MKVTAETTAAVDAAIKTRRSVRAFLPTPIPRQIIEDILAVSSRAPSGVNTQPWKVTVLTGHAKEELSRKILAAHEANAAAGSTGADVGEYDY
jgi:nitroreductase